jgi:hypothetical protein
VERVTTERIVRDVPDRSMQMFVTPAELEDIVVPFAQEDCLWLVADGFLADGRASPTARGIPGVSPHVPGPTPSSRPDDGLAGRAVRLEVPAVVDGALQLVQHDVRTERDDVLRIADRLFRRMKEVSRRPVWGWSADHPDTARPYRDIGIMPGAVAWWRSGKPLGQLGSDFVRFGPEPPLRS